MFADHHVHVALQQERQIEPAAEIAVRQHDVALGKQIVQCAEHAVLARQFPLILADRGFEHRADRK